MTRYIEQIERQMFIRSYQQLTDDPDMLNLAEEGMADYEAELKNGMKQGEIRSPGLTNQNHQQKQASAQNRPHHV